MALGLKEPQESLWKHARSAPAARRRRRRRRRRR